MGTTEPIETTAVTVRPASNGALASSAPSPSPLPQENFINGFEGMAVAPFPKEALAVLQEPVNPEDVEIKPDGICYLPGIFYRDRLMRAFGAGGWACGPRSPAKRAPASGGELVMYHGALVCLGRYVGEAVGQCVYYPNNRGMTYADAFEGAKTDCITRCCKDLGVAKELWDPSWREQWKAKYAHQVKNKKGELVWERRDRPQKLEAAPSPASGAAAGGGSAKASGSPAAATTASAPAPATADPGEAMDPGQLADLEGLIRELGWKKQWTNWWFTRRFGVKHTAISKVQWQTAVKLLHAFANGPDAYNVALGEASAAGLCVARQGDEDRP